MNIYNNNHDNQKSIYNHANVYKSIYNKENTNNTIKKVIQEEDDGKLISIVCKRLNLPIEIKKSYEKLKLFSLYQWQSECLYTSGIINGNNLIYCAPTSGGKTLIAELIILQKVISLNKKAIFILPFVSLVMEKEKYFKRILYQYNLMQPKGRKKRVKSIFGDSTSSILYTDDIIICTIEKANGIINNIILGGQANKIGCIVVDEMHILGDSFNGFLLEILISKIKLLEIKSSTFLKNNQIDDKKLIKIQLIGMSATVGNIDQLARWFGGGIYKTNFRPVPLVESVVISDCLYDTHGEIINKIPSIFNNNNNNNNSNNNNNNNNKRDMNFNDIQSKDIHSRQVVTLTLEALLKGQQIIIFCPTKMSCQQTSKLLTEELYNYFHIITVKSNRSVYGSNVKLNNLITNIDQIKSYKLPIDEIESNLIITHSNNKLNNVKIIEKRLQAIEKLKKKNINTDINLISSIEQGIISISN
jgi:DNA polymerase theta